MIGNLKSTIFQTNRCTSFDISNPSKKGKKIQCYIYGHSNVQPASSVEGTCFKMPTVKAASKKAAAVQTKLENANDLGKGLCRGDKWQDGDNWPKDKSRRSPKECYVACKQTTGCTAFDVSHLDKAGKKGNCYLYGHADIQPASSLEGRCYKMWDVKVSSGQSAGLHLAPNEVKIGDAAIARKLEHGSCRGYGWQDGIWPVDAGLETRKSCAETCVRTSGKCFSF